MKYKLLKWVFLSLSLFMLTACDNDTFNQFFRNPYIVEIAELNKVEANKWYELDKELKALNRNQEILISFDGSEPSELNFFVDDGVSKYTSKKYGEKEIGFNIVVVDSYNIEHKFTPLGSSSGMLFSKDEGEIRTGSIIKKIRMMGNVDFNDVKVTWISRTRK